MDPQTLAYAAPFIQEIFNSVWKGTSKIPDWIQEMYAKNDPFGLEAAKYAEHVISQYNSMRIIGMDRPVPLEGIYINVNIRNELARQLEFDSDLHEWRSAQGFASYRTRGIPAVKAVNDHDRLLVLGRPGAGKTTFLKYLVITSLRRELSRQLVPVFVPLKEWSKTPSTKLETVLIRQFDVCGLSNPNEFVRKLLRDGKCLVLLDGFDEIEAENRSKGISQVEALVQAFPKSRFVLSCRTAANTYVFGGFTEVEIADFDDVQISKFVHKWFDSNIAIRCLAELMSKGNRGLLDLARNPLLLTLICIAYGETHSFPESRVSLYQMALDALLKKWDSSRNIVRFNPYKQLTLQKKEILFSRIAAMGFQGGIDIYGEGMLSGIVDRFMRDFAPDVTYDIADILEAIEAQHGIFVKVRAGEYRFSHLTFQEFYTAKFMVDNSDQTLVSRVLDECFGGSRWHEVLVIAGGLQNDASRYVYELKLRLDRLRTPQVNSILDLARENIKDPNLYDHSVNVILALTQLLKTATHVGEARELQAAAEFADLTARKLCELKGITASAESAMLSVTKMGFAKHRLEHEQSVDVLKAAYETWQSLQRFFLGMHVLLSCLSGETTVPQSYRKSVLELLFVPGCPLPPKPNEGGLFSA